MELTSEERKYEDLEWSDEESDYKVQKQEYVRPMSAVDPDAVVEEVKLVKTKENPIIHEGNTLDYIRKSKIHTGAAKVRTIEEEKENRDLLNNKYKLRIPLPYLPSHVVTVLTTDVVYFLWNQFLNHGADESEMIQLRHLKSIEKVMGAQDGVKLLPFDKVFFRGLEGKDYVEFKDVLNQLVSHMVTLVPHVTAKPDLFCCSTEACTVNAPMGDKSSTLTNIHKPEDRNLYVLYEGLKLELHGKVRNKHIPRLMDLAGISYDKTRQPDSFWYLKGEYLLRSFKDVLRQVDIIRTDLDEWRLQDHSDVYYQLTEWQLESFSSSEIMLFKHHFEGIDIDRTGSVDASGLQGLTTALGGQIPINQAEDLIQEFAFEKTSKKINFSEFMTLMFKLREGTYRLLDDTLSRLMVEARMQLKIFEEIEDLHINPATGVTVRDYGGIPLSCEFDINGPYDTPYEGGTFKLKVTFSDAYPYRYPEVVIHTRVFSVHTTMRSDGSCVLPHLKRHWDRSWNLRQIVEHITNEVLGEPRMEYEDPNLVRIARLWAQEELDIRKREEETKRQAEEDAQRAKAEEERVALEKMNSIRAALKGLGPSDSSVSTGLSDNKSSEYESDSKGQGSGRGSVKSVGGGADGIYSPRQQALESKGESKDCASLPSHAEAKGIVNAAAENKELKGGGTLDGEGDVGTTAKEGSDPVAENRIEWFDYETELENFNRIDQLHVNVLGLFFLDRQTYNETAKRYVRDYANWKPRPVSEYEPEWSEDAEGGAEAVEAAVKEGEGVGGDEYGYEDAGGGLEYPNDIDGEDYAQGGYNDYDGYGDDTQQEQVEGEGEGQGEDDVMDEWERRYGQEERNSIHSDSDDDD